MGIKIVKIFFVLAITIFTSALIYKALHPNDYVYPVTRLFKTIEELYWSGFGYWK